MPGYGEISIPQFTAEVVSEIQREEQKKGLEDAIVNRKCQVVIAILNFAVKQRRIPYNPAQGFSKLREAQQDSKFWSREVASGLLTCMSAKYPKGSKKRTIFKNESGAPIDHHNFMNRIFRRDLKEWGGTRIRFHDLRHTATTLMIACGVDIKAVKEICGYSDIKTTMNYVHLVASSVDKVPLLFSLSPILDLKNSEAEKTR